jgi:adenine-specific DNA methylase
VSVTPFAWRGKPSLIERLLPAQKISAEAQKERKAGAGQTLTALGSYWKGRKPLILVKACVLGALLPATQDSEADLKIFEKLMAIDDEAFLRRGFRPSCLDLVKRLHSRGMMSTEEAGSLFEVRRHRSDLTTSPNLTNSSDLPNPSNLSDASDSSDLPWASNLPNLPNPSNPPDPSNPSDTPNLLNLPNLSNSPDPPNLMGLPDPSNLPDLPNLSNPPDLPNRPDLPNPSRKRKRPLGQAPLGPHPRVPQIVPFSIGNLENLGRSTLQWRNTVSDADRRRWELRWVRSFSYLERVAGAKRPEELEQEELFAPVWNEVNAHLGTEAHSIPELTEQLGILRFGKRPRVGDTFCGGGSIPFEAARMGCDVYASDLNPIACMLTWGALNIIGASEEERREIEAAQAAVAAAVDSEITDLGIEHDCEGNRAKAYLYCLEVRCPQTGWMVPLCSSWVVSKARNVIARLNPDHARRRFDIEIVPGASEAQMHEADEGTLRDGEVVYTLGEETYRTKYNVIRGDLRLPDGRTANKLRAWEQADFMPGAGDILQERLYCIQWITRDTLSKGRSTTFFTGVREEDLVREQRVQELVDRNLGRWQSDGLVPDMFIEPGDETTRLGRERGWTCWHHLFTPRALLVLSLYRSHVSAITVPCFLDAVNFSAKLCRWETSAKRVAADGSGKQTGGASDNSKDVFSNQALNTLFDYSLRSGFSLNEEYLNSYRERRVAAVATLIQSCAASALREPSDLWLTDPPYADAIRYEEITEFFIAWLRKNPPAPFDQWVWDSRRPLAVQGTGEGFRREMTAAYRAMSKHMPDNGLQIVMFTHQDAGVWADMAAIVWGAGLQVTAAWYIATETSSELKKGGYVQGTVLLVLKKRLEQNSAYRDELVQEVRAEVARQIETMTGLNQTVKGAGRSENLFEDQDLQMAGYAAALRVLTGYGKIDGQDMAAEALRPRQTGSSDTVKEIIDFAVQVANEHLVPEGVPPGLWDRLSGPERFYLRMLDIEAGGAKKLDNYQNFAKAFRYGDYTALMASMKPNAAQLKNALELKRVEFESEFGKTPLRAVLFALYELQREVDIDEALGHLRDLVPGYLSRREDLMALASVIAAKRETKVPAEAQAARILFTRIKNERLG